MNNQEDLYYYFADGKRTESKIVAMEYEIATKQKATFCYNDSVYNAINWTIEPPNSLDYYYTEQAKRIRDSYDYVILCYSGGIDSTNILETFHYNGIKLDKIFSVGALSQDAYNGDDSNHNGEIYHNVIPYIEELGLKDIFQMLDYTNTFPEVGKLLLQQKRHWVEHIGGWLSPHNWFWHDIDRYVVPDHMRGKKVAIVFGRDKPLLYSDSGKPHFKFGDSVINAYGFYRGNDNIDVINFYWDPAFTDILVKQLHILKRYSSLTNSIEFDRSRGAQTIGNISVHDLIYNLKKPLPFISKKSSSTILSLRDSYMMQNKRSTVYELYDFGIRSVCERINSLAIPVIYTQKYYLDT